MSLPIWLLLFFSFLFFSFLFLFFFFVYWWFQVYTEFIWSYDSFWLSNQKNHSFYTLLFSMISNFYWIYIILWFLLTLVLNTKRSWIHDYGVQWFQIYTEFILSYNYFLLLKPKRSFIHDYVRWFPIYTEFILSCDSFLLSNKKDHGYVTILAGTRLQLFSCSSPLPTSLLRCYFHLLFVWNGTQTNKHIYK